MPELPEVETLRRSLEPTLVGARVESVLVLRRDVVVVPGDPDGGFSRQRSPRPPTPLEPGVLLEGATVVSLERHGKDLALLARDGRALRVHLGMTGQLRLRPSGSDAPTHEHVRWTLSRTESPRTGATPPILSFIDPRRFGGVWAYSSLAGLRSSRWDRLGPDALTVTPEALTPRLRSSRRAIKAALLDQATLAGVGNIYADEALFLARVSPRRLASSLRAREIEALASAIRDVLARAIQARGSTLRDFVDASGEAGYAQLTHMVYGRGGEACRACGRPLRSATIAQRTTVWCPGCQGSRRPGTDGAPRPFVHMLSPPNVQN